MGGCLPRGGKAGNAGWGKRSCEGSPAGVVGACGHVGWLNFGKALP